LRCVGGRVPRNRALYTVSLVTPGKS